MTPAERIVSVLHERFDSEAGGANILHDVAHWVTLGGSIRNLPPSNNNLDALVGDELRNIQVGASTRIGSRVRMRLFYDELAGDRLLLPLEVRAVAVQMLAAPPLDCEEIRAENARSFAEVLAVRDAGAKFDRLVAADQLLPETIQAASKIARWLKRLTSNKSALRADIKRAVIMADALTMEKQ